MHITYYELTNYDKIAIKENTKGFSPKNYIFQNPTIFALFARQIILGIKMQYITKN